MQGGPLSFLANVMLDDFDKELERRGHHFVRYADGVSISQRLKELRQYARGWMGYFALEQRKSLSRDLDKWLRRRLRDCYWKQWRKPIARVRNLTDQGLVSLEDVWNKFAPRRRIA